jgi:trans-aconitate methyltransferase
MTQWNAADYAKHSLGQFAWALSIIDRLALKGDERVLDIGCGDGKVSAEIASRLANGRVLGVDNAPEMIALAKGTWTGRAANLEFEVGDAQALDVPPIFDVVFSNAAIHWMPDHQSVVRGVARALAPGGRVFLSMGGRGTASPVYRALTSFAHQEPWGPFLAGAVSPHHFRGPDDFEPLLRELGLRLIRLELVPKPIRHADRAALTGWLRTTWMTYTARCPEPLRAGFLEELTNRVTPECTLAEDGALLLPMVNLEVEAVR